ncbi:PEGA domain-containing protein [Candidatus Dojkabacteria bacterium]|jgi:hypothetical protein|nr:PEGA domain-containing protein [Candidatus Dojkabacteria bacterium]
MKILKTATIILVVLVAISLIVYLIPFEKITSYIPFINKLYNNTSLTVNSRNGKAVISVNGKDYGQTPVTISDLSAGEYEISMTRISTSSDFYKEKKVKVELQRHTEAIVDVEIGPNDIISGYVLYYTQSPIKNSDSGYITISSNPSGTNIYLDDEFFQKAPVNVFQFKAGDFNVKVTQDGYEDIKFPIVVRNGYNLNINTYLYPIPINIIK